MKLSRVENVVHDLRHDHTEVDGSDPKRGREFAANSSDQNLRLVGAWHTLYSGYIAQHGAAR